MEPFNDPDAGSSDGPVSFAEQMSSTPPPPDTAPPSPSDESPESYRVRRSKESPFNGKRGRDRRRRRHRQKSISEADRTSAAAMYAMGLTKNRIGKVLDLSKESVNEILRDPAVVEFGRKIREVIRLQSLGNIQTLLDDTYGWLKGIVSARDAKGFDAVTRGLASLERVAASASGDANKLQGQVSHQLGNMSEEAKELVRVLLGKEPGQ